MKLKKYEELIGNNKTENCYILGAGVSLFDISLNKRLYDINSSIISVNSAILLANKINSPQKYWISNDSATTYWSYFKDLLNGDSEIIVRDSWKNYYEKISRDFYLFSARKDMDTKSNSDEFKLCGVSSVPSAIDLAIQIGYKKIFILGLDHYFYCGKSHFWQMWPKEDQPTTTQFFAPQNMQKKMFDENMMYYLKLNDFAKSKKCSIFNCNLNSKIKTFEKIEFEKTL
jgi:hypothetical protein